jgi:pimeloyl-ACP methyl ester carboxylesterase
MAQPTRTRGVTFEPAYKECVSSTAGGHAFTYCIYRAAQGTNGGVVYHFPGRNGDAHGWNDADFYTGQIQAEWQRRKLAPPTVVSVSFGPVWLMMPRTANALSGVLEVFVEHIVPEVETRVGTPRYRAVLGASMGGYNALLAALHRPELFAVAIALCAPVYELTPDASLGELHAFAQRSGADPKLLAGLWMVSRRYVQSAADWRALSLFDLLERAEATTFPELYVSCGLYDPYGNYEGTERFAGRALAKGFPVQWRPLYGGHCAVDVTSVAATLMRE